MGDFAAEVKRYKKEKRYNFGNIDAIGRRLFDLKNDTHELVLSDRGGKRDVDVDDLFDLIIGSIFHGILHLKEYIYILQVYEPRYLAFAQRTETEEPTGHEKEFVRHSVQIVDEAKLGLPEKTKELEELCEEALHEMEQVLRKHRDDERLIRTLYIEQSILDKVYGSGGLSKLYDLMYDDGSVEGYFKTGKSFLDSGFSAEAVAAFDAAIDQKRKFDKKDRRYANKMAWLEQAGVQRKNAQKFPRLLA